MFSTTDTIVAIATPPGRGGLGVVRLSGPDAHRIALGLLGRAAPLVPRHATVSRLLAGDTADSRAIDEVLATFFDGPHSYTAEDVVEITAHGSPVVLEAAVRRALAGGARLAGPGEFTFRAFVNGRLDLTQAEAVADLIAAVTPRQAAVAYDQLGGSLSAVIAPLGERLFDLVARLEASLDFPDEGYRFITSEELRTELDGLRARVATLVGEAKRGAVLRHGATVVLLGAPNAGKSTLFNALVGSSRAIVSPHAGTTRDVIAETIDLEGVPVTLMDTAGVRVVSEDVEGEGVARAWSAAREAAVVLVLVDGASVVRGCDEQLWRDAEALGSRSLLVRTKGDLKGPQWPECMGHPIEVSAFTGSGLDQLRQELALALSGGAGGESPRVTNLRHADLLRRCGAALERAADAARTFGDRLPEEVVLVDLHEARASLEEVTGTKTTEELLASIFQRFCVGK